VVAHGDDHIDTWDLVDRAAPSAIGEYLLDRPRDPLYRLAVSANAWKRRGALVASFWIIRHRGGS
jgi:3-methyladenine DNA glycosylase AlkD